MPLRPQYARGEALDVFCYHGGFALHLAEHCSKVTGVDSSRPALEVADHNAALNGREIEWIEANAFDLLRDYASAGQQYDTIVLDPPAFAKSKSNLETALRGYKELNLRALKMLRPGGILVTCSCSYHVSPARVSGSGGASLPGCPQKSSHPGEPDPGQGPSHPVDSARNRLLEVHHIGCKLMKYKPIIYIDNNTLIFYASFTLIRHPSKCRKP